MNERQKEYELIRDHICRDIKRKPDSQNLILISKIFSEVESLYYEIERLRNELARLGESRSQGER